MCLTSDTNMTAVVKLLVVLSALAVCLGRYGNRYPVSGSWFKDRISKADVESVLSQFKDIGGDTVLLRGAEFVNRTAKSIKLDAVYQHCVVDGRHCVELAEKEMKSAGLRVQAWVTYSYEEEYSRGFVVCQGYDKVISAGGMTFHRVILWLEQYKTADDCNFTNGSRVAVLFTSYTGAGDPHALLLKEAKSHNMSVYMGLPKPPYIREDDVSGQLINAFFQFNYRIIQDHKARFGNKTAMKGYYSDVEVVPDYIINEQAHRLHRTRLPPRFAAMFWRELYFLTGFFDYQLLGSPVLDLTHAGNTTLKGHLNGMKSLLFFAPLRMYLIRDGRGEGRAAYFHPDEKHKQIYDVDYRLWQVLNAKNKSVTTNTTFSDVYYASIAEFMAEYMSTEVPWLLIEAFDDVHTTNWCQPVDPKGSGMERKVKAVEKDHLDRSLSHVGAMVSKVTAFAWDPLFTCHEKGFASLAQQINEDYQRPIISECRFHSPQNLSIVVIGYNIDGPLTQPFQVNYTLYDGTHKSIGLFGYYFELDYGLQHGLVDSLVYIQLYDIPDLKDLQRSGSIKVARTDGTGYPCVFNYNFTDISMSNEMLV